jgi:hypothetical protein
MADVKFLRGSESAYQSLAQKAATTFYFTTDEKNNYNLYLGETKLSNATDIASASKEITDLLGTIPTDLTDIKTFADWIASVATSVSTLDSSLATVAKTGKAEDVSIVDEAGKIEATTVEGALAELAAAISNTGEAGALTIEKNTSVEGVAARYTFKQGTTTLDTTIDIPKDMVVQSGTVETYDADSLPTEDGAPTEAGTYIVLTLANSDNTKIYVNVGNLIEYVTSGSAEDDAIVIAVSEDHKVTASITDGSITKAKLDTTFTGKIDKLEETVGTASVPATETEAKVEATGLFKRIEDLESSVGDGGSVDDKISAALTWSSFESNSEEV